MNLTEIQFKVPFCPVAQPRPRARAVKSDWNGKPRWTAQFYDDKTHPVQMWKIHVVDAGRLAIMAAPDFQFSGPIGVQLEVFGPRAKKSPPTRQWDTRRPSGTGTGDADNMAKSVLDALNGRAWADDCQVARLIVEKTVCSAGEEPHAWITIWDLEPPEPGPGQQNLF